VLTAVAAAAIVVDSVVKAAGTATVHTVSGRIEARLADREQRAAFERAVERAFTQFEKTHRVVASSWFDETFLKGTAASLLIEFFQRRGRLPDSRRLVAAWRNYRLRGGPEAETVEAAAADLVRLLTDELAAEPVLSGFLDSAAWDSIAKSARTNVKLQQIDNLDLLVGAARRLVQAARRTQAGEPDAQDLASQTRDLYRRAVARMKVVCAGNPGQLARVEEIRSEFQLVVLDLYDAFLDNTVTLTELERNIEGYAASLYDAWADQ